MGVLGGCLIICLKTRTPVEDSTQARLLGYSATSLGYWCFFSPVDQHWRKMRVVNLIKMPALLVFIAGLEECSENAEVR